MTMRYRVQCKNCGEWTEIGDSEIGQIEGKVEGSFWEKNHKLSFYTMGECPHCIKRIVRVEIQYFE